MKHRVIDWDPVAIRPIDASLELHRILWSDIRRTGYVTENTGIAITDEYFLAVETARALFLISLSIPEALELTNEVERRFPPTFGPEGSLASRTDNASVVTWPALEAGKEMFPSNSPIVYVTARPDLA